MTDAPGGCRLRIRIHNASIGPRDETGIERAFGLTLAKYEAELREVEVSVIKVEWQAGDWVSCQVVARDRANRVVRAESQGREPQCCATRAFLRVERALRRHADSQRWRLAAGVRAVV